MVYARRWYVNKELVIAMVTQIVYTTWLKEIRGQDFLAAVSGRSRAEICDLLVRALFVCSEEIYLNLMKVECAAVLPFPV